MRPVLIAAGGTGGHLFPAQALSEVLVARGIPVELMTDERATRYGATFPARMIHHVGAATPSGGSLWKRARAILTLLRGTHAARGIIRRVKPRAVVGFGGYPTVPPVLAAAQLGVPTILHEQNAVMGRANRFLARRVRTIAKGFDNLAVDQALAGKTRADGQSRAPERDGGGQAPLPELRRPACCACSSPAARRARA